MKRTLPLVITFFAGAIVIVNSFFVLPWLNTFVSTYLSRSVTVSTAWAVGLGALNLMRQHVRRTRRGNANQVYSIVLIITFVIFLVGGLILDKHQQNPLYQQWFVAVQNSLSATMFSVLAFYIATSAFRAFRVRNVDSTLLLLSAFVVMLGAVPIGEAIWSGFPDFSDWIMNIVNTSSLRAMGIGLTLGGLAQSMRTLVGVERGHLGGGE